MIIDQLPLMSGNPQDDDEFPIERGTTTYKTKLQALAAGIFGKIASSATPLMDGTASPGTGTSAARADHVHPTDTSRASAAELATYVRPNLLDNWYFVGGGSQLGYGVFPINQRGQTSYSNAGHTIDRWRTDGSLTVNAGGISLNGTTLYQLLSATVAKKLLGKTVTASALFADGTLLSGTATFPTSISETSVIAYPGTYNKLRYALVAGGSIQLLRFQMGSRDADIVAAKVEIGSTQTLAHQENGAWVLNEIPDYAVELDKCKYYFERIGKESGYIHVGNGYVGGWGSDSTIGNIFLTIHPKVRFCSSADITINGTFYLWKSTAIAGNAFQATSKTDSNCSESGHGFIAFNNLSNFTLGECISAQIRDNDTTYIDISAES